MDFVSPKRKPSSQLTGLRRVEGLGCACARFQYNTRGGRAGSTTESLGRFLQCLTAEMLLSPRFEDSLTKSRKT